MLAGCAKFPIVGTTRSTRIIVSMDVVGEIHTGVGVGGSPYIYMVGFRFSDLDTPIDSGPIPVVAPPWGNGFMAGHATHFVWWDPNAGNEYLIYQFRDPSTLAEWFPLGVPISSETVSPGVKRIKFEFDLSQLYPVQADRDALRSMQVNFFAMDKAPQAGTTKQWDSLGDSRLISSINDFVLIPLNTSAIYDNLRSGNLEPDGDQANPDLDIHDWSVEVRLQ